MNATMPDLVETLLEEPRWAAADLPALAERAARATLAHLGLAAEGFEISLLACDDARMAALNAEFRNKAGPTNVLSWPSQARGAARDGARPDLPAPGDAADPFGLGDLALAFETCAREAAEAGRSLEDHAAHLVVHGVLHLLGHDHMRPKDAALMERLEVEILARLGVADPYGGAAGG